MPSPALDVLALEVLDERGPATCSGSEKMHRSSLGRRIDDRMIECFLTPPTWVLT